MDIGRNSAIVAPVINKIDNQLETVFLCRRHNIIQPLQSICASINCGPGSRQVLVPDRAGTRDGVHIVEAPDADNLETG